MRTYYPNIKLCINCGRIDKHKYPSRRFRHLSRHDSGAKWEMARLFFGSQCRRINKASLVEMFPGHLQRSCLFMLKATPRNAHGNNRISMPCVRGRKRNAFETRWFMNRFTWTLPTPSPENENQIPSGALVCGARRRWNIPKESKSILRLLIARQQPVPSTTLSF